MTLEQGLTIAVTVLGGAVLVLWGLMQKEILEGRADRKRLNERVGKLEHESGVLKGRLLSYENCPSTSCPFNKARPARWKDGQPTGELPSV